MCLYPKLIQNPKYKENKKNGGKIPVVADIRLTKIPAACGVCIECKKQKANQWRIRLNEEIRQNPEGHFVTLTFSEQSLAELDKAIPVEYKGYQRDNAIASLAVKRFRERYRKDYMVSIKHWLITELGHEGTERIHLHGVLWMKPIVKDGKIIKVEDIIKKYWKYGWIYKGYSMNERTINYIVKYVMKTDLDHKTFKPKILTSAGIGKGYLDRWDSKLNKYKIETDKTDQTYYYKGGAKARLPQYYRNKLYNDDEREILWLEMLDKQERYVLGTKVSIKDDETEYKKLRDYARNKAHAMGYVNPEKMEDDKKYEKELRELNRITRIEKLKKIKNEKSNRNN